MIPKEYEGDYQGFLRAAQKEQAKKTEQHLIEQEKRAGRLHKQDQRKKTLSLIYENKTLLLWAYPILSEERIATLKQEIHEAALSILDTHLNSFHELRELYNAIPSQMPDTDHWILHDIKLRLETREDRDFHQKTGWQILQRSSREFPLTFALRFWDIQLHIKKN